MPITAETFDVEHFEALRRGLDAAEGALKLRDEQLDAAEQEREKLTERVGELASEIEQLKAQPWNALINFILDVDRGSHEFPELIDWLRVKGHIDPR